MPTLSKFFCLYVMPEAPTASKAAPSLWPRGGRLSLVLSVSLSVRRSVCFPNFFSLPSAQGKRDVLFVCLCVVEFLSLTLRARKR